MMDGIDAIEILSFRFSFYLSCFFLSRVLRFLRANVSPVRSFFCPSLQTLGSSRLYLNMP